MRSRGSIEEILKFKVDLGSKLQEIKFQGSICKRRRNAGLDTILARGPIKKC